MIYDTFVLLYIVCHIYIYYTIIHELYYYTYTYIYTGGRQDRKLKYMSKLKSKFSHLPEVRRIVKDIKVPKRIKKAKAIEHVQRVSERRKNENRIKHSKEGTQDIEPERSRAVIKEFA